MKESTYALKEEIWGKVHELVDKLTEELPATEDYELRQSLTEEFRFWRRKRF